MPEASGIRQGSFNGHSYEFADPEVEKLYRIWNHVIPNSISFDIYYRNAGFELVFEDGVCIVCEDFLRIKRFKDEDYTTINIDVYAPGMTGLEKVANAIKKWQCYYDGEQYAIVEDGHVNAPYWQKQEKVSAIK